MFNTRTDERRLSQDGLDLVTRSRTTIKICSYPRFALKFAGSRLLRRTAWRRARRPTMDP